MCVQPCVLAWCLDVCMYVMWCGVKQYGASYFSLRGSFQECYWNACFVSFLISTPHTKWNCLNLGFFSLLLGRGAPCHFFSWQDQLLHLLRAISLRVLFVSVLPTAFWFCVGSSLYNPFAHIYFCFASSLLLHLLFIHPLICVYVWVSPFLPLCGSQWLNSLHQAWWQVCLPTEPSHWPSYL